LINILFISKVFFSDENPFAIIATKGLF